MFVSVALCLVTEVQSQLKSSEMILIAIFWCIQSFYMQKQSCAMDVLMEKDHNPLYGEGISSASAVSLISPRILKSPFELLISKHRAKMLSWKLHKGA